MPSHEEPGRGGVGATTVPPGVLDAVLSAAITVLVLVGVWAETASSSRPVAFPVGAYALGGVAGAVLLLRRRRPFVSAAGVLLAVAIYHFAGYPGGAPALALFATLFSLASGAATVWPVVAAVIIVPVWLVIPSLPPNPTPWYAYATTGPAMGMLWVIALGVAARHARRSAAREIAAAQTAAEARLTERLAEERLALARDVHDVLAHTLSAFSVQSAAALDAFDAGQPGRAQEAVRRMRTLATQANPELRRALTVLRRGGEEAEGRSSQPSLDQLGALVATAEQADVTVRVDASADLGALGPLVNVSAYRIVQESITNVIKHSLAQEVTVTVRTDGPALLLEIADRGPRRFPDAAGAGAGFGIRGMRERAAAVGGFLEAGPLPSGGFLVRAELPLTGERGIPDPGTVRA